MGVVFRREWTKMRRIGLHTLKRALVSRFRQIDPEIPVCTWAASVKPRLRNMGLGGVRGFQQASVFWGLAVRVLSHNQAVAREQLLRCRWLKQSNRAKLCTRSEARFHEKSRRNVRIPTTSLTSVGFHAITNWPSLTNTGTK